MNDISVLLTSARETLGWADEAVQEIIDICKAFFDEGPCAEATYYDFPARQFVCRVKMVKPLPPSIARKTTEAMSNIKNAFDQITFCALRTRGLIDSNKTVYFPWAETPTDLEHLLRSQGCSVLVG